MASLIRETIKRDVFLKTKDTSLKEEGTAADGPLSSSFGPNTGLSSGTIDVRCAVKIVEAM